MQDKTTGANDMALVLPLASLSKKEIDAQTEDWLNTALENHTADELYVFSKQLSTAADYIVEKLKGVAFDAIANRFGGETKGEILGHKISLSWPEKWVFSEAVAALEKHQKLQLDVLKAEEKAKGIAHKEQQSGRITVVIRGA